MNFHPFLMSAAAGIPPNPYMASLLNSLPHNSPLRQLVNVDSSEEMLTKRAAELMNGMNSFDPTHLQHLHHQQQQHHHHHHLQQRDPHRQRSSLSSSNRSQMSRSPSPNSCDESMSSSKPHDDLIMNGKNAREGDHEDEEDEDVAQDRAIALRAAVARRLAIKDDEMIGDDPAKDMSKPTSVINSPSHGDEREPGNSRRVVVAGGGIDDDDITDHDEDGDEKDKIDNNVQRLLDTVNANVTRQVLEAFSVKNGYSVEKMLGSGGESSCDPMMSPRSVDDSQHSRPTSRFGDDYDMDEDRSQDQDSEIHNNNNSIISNGTAEELMKLNGGGGGSKKKGKNGGVEGLAARLELCQNDATTAAAAAAFGSKAAASFLLQIQRQQHHHHRERDDKANELDQRKSKEDSYSDYQQRRHDDENPSSQSENEMGDHRKYSVVINSFV